MTEQGVVTGALTESDFTDRVPPLIPGLVLLAARLTSWGQAEDIVQDALTRAWTKRAQFDESCGTLRSWLLAITADQARQEHRRLASRARRLWPVAAPEPQPTPDHRELEATDRPAAAPATNGDPVLLLRRSQREGGGGGDALLRGNVKSTLSDGRKRLKTLLEGADG